MSLLSRETSHDAFTDRAGGLDSRLPEEQLEGAGMMGPYKPGCSPVMLGTAGRLKAVGVCTDGLKIMFDDIAIIFEESAFWLEMGDELHALKL